MQQIFLNIDQSNIYGKRFSGRITIAHQEGPSYTVQSKVSLWQIVEKFFAWILPCLTPHSYRKENQRVIDAFYESFGKNRVIRIMNRAGIDIERLHYQGRTFTKNMLEILLLGTTQVYDEDLKEHFSSSSLDHLTKQQIDGAFWALSPYLNKGVQNENLFRISQHKDLARIPFSKVRFRWKNMAYGNFIFFTRDMKSWQQKYNVLKKVIHVGMDTGLIIPTKNGYFHILEPLTRIPREMNGFYVKLLAQSERKREKTSRTAISVFLCPTLTGSDPAPLKAKLRTWLEDVRFHAGSLGPVQLYREILEKLDTLSPHQPVNIVGYSLGGVQAQRLALLLRDRVCKLTTIGAPGIERQVDEKIGEKRTFRIHHIFNEDDLIPHAAGECHLGLSYPKDVRVTYYSRKETLDNISLEYQSRSILRWIRLFFQSLFGAHAASYVATKHPYYPHKIPAEDPRFQQLMNHSSHMHHYYGRACSLFGMILGIPQVDFTHFFSNFAQQSSCFSTVIASATK